MGLWDALRGRRTPVAANLDALFGLPNAALTLQTAAGFVPTGMGAVCFRAAEGPAFAETVRDVVTLLDNDDDPDVEQTTDDYGFTWLLARQEELPALVTDLHAVNTAVEAQGFTDSLLCSMVSFADATGRRFGLVYLYKRGTFYPFAPAGPNQRDNLLEIQVRDLLKGELPVEPELNRWLALWGAPGL